LAYIAGLVLVLILIAHLGQKLTAKLQFAATSGGWFKKVIGILFIIVGIFIISGLDKQLQTKVLDSGYFDITQVEERLLENIAVEELIPIEQPASDKKLFRDDIHVPRHLQQNFPGTNWDNADPALIEAISGGPPKDGIPALENPNFIPLSAANYPDEIQAIVLQGETVTKVYPYNILTWHEIVNDTIDDNPVAVTFCPLCGSAIVFDRTLPNGTVSTFGVSGSLLESNMIMYDRETESLWQQSTGAVLAGTSFPGQLSLVPMQLMTLGEIRLGHPDAIILSRLTGHDRDYTHNPYAGYETDNRFVFEPSTIDAALPAKTIMAIFRTAEKTPTAIPWLTLREKGSTDQTIDGLLYIFSVTPIGELTITDANKKIYPFYFEMWFSFTAQHGDTGELLTL
jgi:hypothetical protein